MVFHFEAFPNAFMTGTYMVVVDYGNTGLPPATFDDTNNLYRVFVDLEEGSSVTVTVPYVSFTPWKLASDEDVPLVSVYSVTKLQVNSGGASEVPFRVFFHAENVRFMWPFYSLNTPGAHHPVVAKEDKGKGKEILPINNMNQDEVSMIVPYAEKVILGPVNSRFQTITPEDYMIRFGAGESITSVKELLKRFYYLKAQSAPATFGLLTFIHDPSEITNFPVWMQNLYDMFVFYYGGYRYKILPRVRAIHKYSCTWSPGSSVNELEPLAIASDISMVEAQVNAPCQYPYRVIKAPTSPMPRFFATLDDTADSFVYFSVSDSFQFFGKGYLTTAVEQPDSALFVPQTYKDLIPE